MSPQSHRLAGYGSYIKQCQTIEFTFDNKPYTGYPGDTLASALLANGIHLTGRSFKYHRPRGIYTAGTEEPNALVTLNRAGRTEPNIPATGVELYDGLEAHSQNRWPSLKFDLMAVNSLVKPLFAAGFYYKTFMWPRSFWYKLYEPVIRRAAGLGALRDEPDPDSYAHSHVHTDILVIGAGPAGLVAAQAAARDGASVLLVDDQPLPGGHLAGETQMSSEPPNYKWACNIAAKLNGLNNLRLLQRTTVFGRYDDMVFGAIERVSDHLGPSSEAPRQRFVTIHAKQFICATGAIERPLVFDNNDRPGVMLAGAARTYLNRYGVLPGRHVVICTNNDSAYLTARDLATAGADVTVVDTRPKAAVSQLLSPAVETIFAHSICRVNGRSHVTSVTIAPLSPSAAPAKLTSICCDLVCLSGGWNPTIHLLSHLGKKPIWNDGIASYKMTDMDDGVQVVGGAAGIFDSSRALRDAVKAGHNAAAALSDIKIGPNTEDAINAAANRDDKQTTADDKLTAGSYSVTPFWRLPKHLSDGTKSFVDLQNDVTISDLELAEREGFGHAEHAKRYTTLGMGTDQGRLSNVNALGILAVLRGKSLRETGTTTFRPLFGAVSLGALSSAHKSVDLAPYRHSAMHNWHLEHGAIFTHTGLWLRPYYYPRAGEDFATAVKREVLSVRSSVGMVDISTLGKIELKGPDAGNFLELLYVNSFAKLKINRVRYGLMLREDGMAFDDGTVTKLADNHYFITVTTANAEAVLQHMEHCHQIHWPEMDVQFCSVGEAWSAMAIAGPHSRAVLADVIEGLDLDNEALPFMAVGEGHIDGAFIRVLRISFSGELAYEIYTSPSHGHKVWEAIMRSGHSFGIVAYGTEAMTVMRTEKGHIAGPEIDGRTTADDLGLGRMMARKKDYIGRMMASRLGQHDHGNSHQPRLQLVGLKPLLQPASFRAGAQLVTYSDACGPNASQGHVTTAVYSPTCDHFIGLALLRNGRARTGERLYALSPLHKENCEVEVTNPVFVDPKGSKMHG